MDTLRERYVRVEVMGTNLPPSRFPPPRTWMSLERSDSRVTFLLERGAGPAESMVRAHFAPDARIEMRPASLREVFVGLATMPMERVTEVRKS
jgi:hypothetical protein